MKKLSTYVLPAALAMLAATTTIASATVTDATLTDDEMIFGTSSKVDTGNASGAGPGLFAGADGSSNIKRSLLLFDLSAISGTASVVTLDLWIGQIAGSGGGGGGGGGCGMGCTYPERDFALYPSTTAWHEGHVGNTACSGSPCATMGGTGQGWSYTTCGTFSSSPCLDDATWLYHAWTGTTGVDEWSNEPNDQDYGYGSQGTPMATLEVDAPFSDGDMVEFVGSSSTNPDFLAEVQTWMNTPGDNLGFELRSTNLEGSPTSFLGFWSKDGDIASGNGLRPVLEVTY